MLSDELNYDAFLLETSQVDTELNETLQILQIDKPGIPWMQSTTSTSNSLNDDEKRTATRYRLFAKTNNLTFIGNLAGRFPDPESVFARFHLMSPFRSITYGFIMPFNDGWLEVGQLRFVEGKTDEAMVRHAYVKVVSSIALPDLCIDAKYSALNPTSVKKQYRRQQTESAEFDRNFHLYAPDKQMIEVLSILAPNIMELLLAKFDNCDIEFHDGSLFIVVPNYAIESPEAIDELLRGAIEIIELLIPRTKRISKVTSPATIGEYLTKFNYTLTPLEQVKQAAHTEAIRTAILAVVAVIGPLIFFGLLYYLLN